MFDDCRGPTLAREKVHELALGDPVDAARANRREPTPSDPTTQRAGRDIGERSGISDRQEAFPGLAAFRGTACSCASAARSSSRTTSRTTSLSVASKAPGCVTIGCSLLVVTSP